jgi:Inner membrane protein YgaP-like, transmembrane domain
MKLNVASPDRIVRTVLGIGAVVWAAALGWTSLGGILLIVVGAVLLVTAAVGFCPLYYVFKFSTRSASDGGFDAHKLEDSVRH